jgi:hypothetical protein
MRLLTPAELQTVQAAPQPQSDQGIRFLQGTIQRINYATRKLSLIAAGRVWHMELAADSLLWFNGRRAIFRCLQPLDQARVFYESRGSGLVVAALYVWTDE